jgi:hypothetical protein
MGNRYFDALRIAIAGNFYRALLPINVMTSSPVVVALAYIKTTW